MEQRKRLKNVVDLDPILYSSGFHKYSEYRFDLENVENDELLIRLFMHGIIPPDKFTTLIITDEKAVNIEMIFNGFIALDEFPLPPNKETFTCIWDTPLIYPTCLNLRNLFPEGFLPRWFNENGHTHPLYYIFEMKHCHPRNFLHSELRYIHLFVYVIWYYFNGLPFLQQHIEARAGFYKENLSFFLVGMKKTKLKQTLLHYQEKIPDYIQDFETKVEHDPEFVAIFHSLLSQIN